MLKVKFMATKKACVRAWSLYCMKLEVTRGKGERREKGAGLPALLPARRPPPGLQREKGRDDAAFTRHPYFQRVKEQFSLLAMKTALHGSNECFRVHYVYGKHYIYDVFTKRNYSKVQDDPMHCTD